MFHRVAVVNRGEAAMRFINAAREFRTGSDRALHTIALYTAAEPKAMFVRESDESFEIASSATNPYLDYGELERALRATGAEAVWVGWGFVAEHAAFSDLCESLGVVFIGPPGSVMRRLGDKIGAKLLAEGVGVPVAAWSGGAVASLDEAVDWAATIGYPLMVKAAAGGGGRGIRLVEGPDGLASAWEGASREAAGAFGDATLFLERVVTGARHVEVQVIADHHDNVWAIGVRDCSIQRRHQKIMEESASTALDAEMEAEAKAAAIRLARAAAYRNAGTVEFLYEPRDRRLAFLEVNTRLQVEHPVTEMTTGLDLVKLQIEVAAGARLEGDPPPVRGHAIEVRLNAEDPGAGFAPAPGGIAYAVWPTGPGIRVDTGYGPGDVVPSQYDSMVAKVLAWGQDREEARVRLRRALADTTLLVRGGMTNKAFVSQLLDHADVVGGRFSTGWLDELMAAVSGQLVRGRNDVALIAAAMSAGDANMTVERARLFAAAARGRAQGGHDVGYAADLQYAGHSYRIGVDQTGPGRYRVTAGGQAIEVELDRLGGFERRLTIDGRRFRVVSLLQGTEDLVEVDGVPHRVSQDAAGVVRAPAPGVVVDLRVQPGDEVSADTAVAVIESMKMEVAIRATVAGRVSEVLVTRNVQVDAGAPLVRIEVVSGEVAEAAAPSVLFDQLMSTDSLRGSPLRCLDALRDMRNLVLGYDFSPPDVRQMVADYRQHRPLVAGADEAPVDAELELLTTFADLCMLSRNRRVEGGDDDDATHNPRGYFISYLQTLDVDRSGLPGQFTERLRRALAHYGVSDLERGPDLEDGLYWMYLAQKRVATQLPAVLAVLEWQLHGPVVIARGLRDRFLGTLDHLIMATQVRHPVVGDLARSVRFSLFDHPLIAAERSRVMFEMAGHLERLGDPDLDPQTRRSVVNKLVDCPLPLIDLMGDLVGREGSRSRHDLIDVLTRRYYQVRVGVEVRSGRTGLREVVVAKYPEDDHDVQVVAADLEAPELSDPTTFAALVALAAPTVAVLDLYVRWEKGGPHEDELRSQVAAGVAAVGASATVARVTVTTMGPPDPGEAAAVERFTFQPEAGSWIENRALRGLHPMIAERLHLWRLANFKVSRLPSANHVYLFDCVARDVPSDRRLVALAEVRDLTPLRDGTGQVAALPELERVLASCLDAIRRARANRPTGASPQWNRIVLYAWPVIDVPIEELLSVVRRLAPTTDGLDLEQVIFQGRLATPDREGQPIVVRVSRPPGTGLTIRITDPPTVRMQPIDDYAQKVLQARRRGTVYPYELIHLLLRGGADSPAALGTFVEYDLDDDDRLVPVERAPGQNTAALIVGVVSTPTERYPEGMTRVVLLGDPTKGLGSLAEPECRRVSTALDLAESLGVPVEWFALSSGAKIAMDSGTENMDWISHALRRIVGFTQAGGEINLIVAGINVGAQPYWNAEATMLMHTRGILVMTPDSAMVLTGKQALEYSGGVAAEDNFGIGGYDTVMGPNGQAQYWAPDLAAATTLLFAHYAFTYVAPGERFPRPRPTWDPKSRDVSAFPHEVEGIDFVTVGEIFSPVTNPDRKKPFDIRTVIRAVIDQDHPPLERWAEMRDADTAVVLDAFLGGQAVTVIGAESRALPRRGVLPADGPSQWTAGTLFPQSSKKVARAINAASGNRPVVVLANLSGFDGSPESLRNLQLEYGAEIARAVVNFDGPIVFCVVSRYHGGAFVVFSARLNDHMEVAAVEGSFASVIGGPPAAAVVFTGEVNARTEADERVAALRRRLADAPGSAVSGLRVALEETRAGVRSDKLGQVAEEFERIHTIERARQVGSIHVIIPADQLRPYLIDAVERGMRRTLPGARP